MELRSDILWEVSAGPASAGFLQTSWALHSAWAAPWWLWSCHQNPSSRSMHGCTAGSTPQKCQWQSWTQEPGKSRQGLGKMGEKILNLSCHPIPSPGTTLSHPGGCKPLQRGPWSQWSCDNSAETVTALTSWTYRKTASPSGCPLVQRKRIRWLWWHCKGGCAFRSR